MRPERDFKNLDALKIQMQADLAEVRNFFNK
jgi:FAD synthase